MGRKMAVQAPLPTSPHHGSFQTMTHSSPWVPGRCLADVGAGAALDPSLATGRFTQKTVLSPFRFRILYQVLLVRITCVLISIRGKEAQKKTL